MPFNGSGQFNRLYSWALDFANGVLRTAPRMDADADDMADGLSNCITRDGQSVPTDNIPMGNFRLTSLGAPAADNDAVRRAYLDSYLIAMLGGAPTTTGSANAQAVTISGNFTALADGLVISFTAGYSNTAAATLDVNGEGAKSIRKGADAALTGGEIVAGARYLAQYSEAANSAAGGWVLLNPTAAISVKSARGSAAAPAWTFDADPNTGIYSPADEQLAITTNGTRRAIWTTSAFTSDLLVLIPNGSDSAPGIAFSAESGTGIYRPDTGQLGFSTLGTLRGYFTTSAFLLGVPVYAPNGSSGTPAYNFANDQDTGIYLITAGQLGFSVAGTLRAYMTTTAFLSGLPIGIPDGTAATCGLMFANENSLGIYRSSGTELAISAGSAARVKVGSTYFASQVVYDNTSASGTQVTVDSSGILHRSTSAAKYKQDIEPITDDEIERFLTLDGISYRSNIAGDDQSRRYFGILADQAHEVGLSGLVFYGADGAVEDLAYGRNTAFLLEVAKRLDARLKILEGI